LASVKWARRQAAIAPYLPARAFPVLIQSEPEMLQLFVLTRFLQANRYPLRLKTL
jgi:hypothetical protein